MLITFLLGNQVQGSAGRHTSGQTLDSGASEVRDGIGLGGNNGDRVRGGDKGSLTNDHVTVTIAIGSSTKADVLLLDALDQFVGIGQVGVRVSTAKVRTRLAVHDGLLGETELLDKDALTIGTGDTVHAVKEDGEAGGLVQEVLDEIKVKDVLKEDDIVGNRVDNLNLEVAGLLSTDGGEINLSIRISNACATDDDNNEKLGLWEINRKGRAGRKNKKRETKGMCSRLGELANRQQLSCPPIIQNTP